MKTLILLAGAAALASTAPAAAKPGHGNGHGNHYSHGGKYGVNDCPPGLAKKHNGCLPPGQVKKRYDIGQRIPYGYNGYTSYDRLPYDLRNRYDLDPYGRYIYDNNYLYQVDPKTMVVRQILSAILR